MKTLSSLFLLILFLSVGCVPAPSNIRKSSVTSSATTTKNGNNIYPTFASDESLYWFTTNKVQGTVTLNKNSQDIIYIRGKAVHDFLSAKDSSGTEYYRKQYCMVGNFSTIAYKQVRVRAIPIYVTTSSKAIERLLRVDIPSGTDSTSACKFSTIDSTQAINAAFSLPEICTSCTGFITSTNLNMYEAKTSTLAKIDTNLLNLSTLFIKTDLTSNTTDPGNSCTNSSCSAKGFDCCISGQCVLDASEKTNASSYSEYAQAKTDYAANPLNFINYPNIFYVCSNISHTPPAVTPPVTSTPVADAQARVTKYLADYTCTTNVVAGSGYLTCRNLNSSGIATAIDKTEAAYTAIKKKLAIACGCTAIDSEMAVKCPDWGVTPIYPTGAAKINANITDFACYTPAPSNPIGPITNLNVSVPNRSAPHRFYSSTGINYDDLIGVRTTAPSTVQEGADFSYADEYNKIGPDNGSFNINSVLGRMTIDLSHTIPAKLVNVELGKTYILSATSGYFTPCSQCAKDSWFQTFSAHPTSQRGKGLQATGYTTTRDTYSANTTLGNYEDTKFGRACYVPVTMLPLSHQKNTNLITQRQNRLKTQAAFYINGYQRDWFGFNKGALIGSFDGVTWFAVGTGRRATATSTKLYLALNASFLDLADKTDTVVNIIPDSSGNTAADFDYDPDIAITDSLQNTGATCQKFHQCSVDADCVAQLGWEYTCADVSQAKTKWPLYDSDAKETANQEKTSTLFEILQATISTSSSKRCVYRGAGAPCKRDYSTYAADNVYRKTLTCAPNFYCANLTTNKFNNELARSPNEFDNILFGMDANVLGRPLNYVTASKTLDGEITSNIQYNASSAIGMSDSSDMGICRPGKLLDASSLTAHKSPDVSKRTDYISQIGSCDATDKTVKRFLGCPAFDDDLNYIDSTNVNFAINRETQNACGAEAKIKTTSLSAFASIEGLSLLNSQNISQPTFARDACLRRAGSICHTDFDCGPNRMHEDLVGSMSINYFGKTEAEQNYWRESLVCGQGTPQPAIGSVGYFDYKLSDNRCCREIGKDFTMYTQGPKSIVPENVGTNENLLTTRFPYSDPAKIGTDNSVDGPESDYRYSRYTISKSGKNDITKIPKVAANVEPAKNQWQVVNETGSLTCCGGGWIRKFADGSHDWKVKNRLSIDSSNFSCLNFRSPLADTNYNSFAADQIVATSYQREYENFCKSPDGSGCLQIPYQAASQFNILSPLAYEPSLEVEADNYILAPSAGYSRLNTSPTIDPIDGSTPWSQILNNDVPYSPLPYYFSPISYDVDPRNNLAYNFFTSKSTDYGVEFYLPAYIGWDTTSANTTFVKKVYIKYFYNTPQQPVVFDITGNLGNATECANVINSAHAGYPISSISTDNTWCIVSNAKTQNRPVVIVKGDTSVGNAWKYAGVIIDFKPLENKRGTKVAEPGSALYYLSKLARFELLGIPQITYEPLYCNNNQDNLVPGLFIPALKTRSDFNTAGIGGSYSGDPIARYNDNNSPNTSDPTNYGNYEKKFTFQNKVDHAAVFSSKDFTCCTPLGKAATAESKCCSGKAVLSSDGKSSICKLPKGTDIHVYFNKFVSSEGVGDDQPGGGLTIKGTDTEMDFNAFSGEPKFRDSTYDKLAALGGAYCDGGNVIVGGAFGAFPPEPFSGTYSVLTGNTGNVEDSFPVSIVDSILDFQKSDSNVGKIPYDSGFKWNHHYYCK